MSRSVDRACGVPDCPDLGSGFVRPVVRVFWSAQGGARLSRSLGVQEYTYGRHRPGAFRCGYIRTTRYTLDTSHHAGGLRPIESMAAAQMQQLETNVVQRRPEQQPSAAAAANVFTTAQHASLYRPAQGENGIHDAELHSAT